MWKFVFYIAILVVTVDKIQSVTFVPGEKLDKSLLVFTNNGIVHGRKDVTEVGKGYWKYQGIPYAKPPLGELRFRTPIPATPWQGILNASNEAPNCIETYPDAPQIFSWGYEDCLYINVYTSQNPQSSRKRLPVLVWIYGGGFTFGNSSSSFYGHDNLMEQNIVLVTFNYRVGLFGFLSTEDMASPGNYGLKDQLLALKWVQENIENFGGDRKRVTVMGQSAGASSIFYHLVSPKSKGLFRSAIASSGSPLCTWAYQGASRGIAFDIGAAARIHTENSYELVHYLRKVDVETLKRLSRLLLLSVVPRSDKEGFPFGPIIEPQHKDAIITKNTYSLLEKGMFHKIPILMGMNTLEMMLFAGVVNIRKPFDILYDISPGSIPNPSMNIRTPEEKRQAGLKIKSRYFKKKSFLGATEREMLYYASDDQFIRPLTKTIQLVSRYTPVYVYLFSYVSNYGVEGLRGILDKRLYKGTAHLEEEWYIWRRGNTPPPTGIDRLMSLRILKMWTNFIYNGNPTPDKDELLQTIIWPAVTSANNITYLNINKNLTLNRNYRQEHMKFWDELYHDYGHSPYVIF